MSTALFVQTLNALSDLEEIERPGRAVEAGTQKEKKVPFLELSSVSEAACRFSFNLHGGPAGWALAGSLLLR